MKTNNFKSSIMTSIRLFILIVIAGWGMTSCGNRDVVPDAYGNFEADEVIVSAEASGKLLQLAIAEGATIDQNKVVGLVDTIILSLQMVELTAQQNKVTTALTGLDAQIAVLKQQKENLEIDLERVQNMRESGASTQKQLDDLTGSMKVIDRQIDANLAQKRTTQSDSEVINAKNLLLNEQLNKCRITNPIKGTVIEKYAEQGEMTAPGKPLYKIANLEKIILRAYVSGAQLINVKVGQECTVRVDNGKKEYSEFSGRISWVSQKAEFTPKIIQTKEERVNMVYAVKIEVPNDGSLKLGMPGEVIIK